MKDATQCYNVAGVADGYAFSQRGYHSTVIQDGSGCTCGYCMYKELLVAAFNRRSAAALG